MNPESLEITITRTLRAPRDLVFRAWTEAERVAQWFAPLGFSARAELDVRPGGRLHIVMVAPDGAEYPIRGTYREISPTTRLVYIEDIGEHPQAWHDQLRALMDKHGAHHPPSNCLVTVQLEALAPALTRMSVTTRAESAGEIAAYAEMGMVEGFGHCFDKLQDLLAEGRTLKIERWFDAPRDAVYRAFTDPEHLARWWGPNGFTLSTYHHEARVGGEWRYHMHGPDGTDYPNKVVYEEVVENQRLAFAHGELEGPAWFHATITFAEHEGRTHVALRQVYDTQEMAEKVKQYGALEGGNQTLARCAEALSHRLEIGLPDDLTITMTRTLAAPRALVWRAMTERALLMKWWGAAGRVSPGGSRAHGARSPAGLAECALDFRVGGQYRFVERDPEGHEHAFRGEYLAIEAPVRAQQTFIYEPMPEHVATVTIELVEVPGGTRMVETITHSSQEARDGHLYSGMEVGANKSMDQLDDLLAELTTALVLTRTVAAPIDRVWAAFTRREHLLQWWGPAGLALEIKHFDLQPGGTMLYAMTPPGGAPFFGKWHVRVVEPPHVLEVLTSFCDAEGHIQGHEMVPVWPLRMRTRFAFEAVGDQTRLTLTNAPFGGTEAEVAAFVAGHPDMQGGFGATFDQLDAFLAQGSQPTP